MFICKCEFYINSVGRGLAAAEQTYENIIVFGCYRIRKNYATVGTTLAVVRESNYKSNLLRTGASPVPTVRRRLRRIVRKANIIKKTITNVIVR